MPPLEEAAQSAATQDSNLLSRYLALRRYVPGDDKEITLFGELHRDFRDWCALQGLSLRPLTRAWLRACLLEVGYEVFRRRSGSPALLICGIARSAHTPSLPHAALHWTHTTRAMHDLAQRETLLSLDLSYRDRRRLPPNEYTWQRFVEACVLEGDEAPESQVPRTRGKRFVSLPWSTWDTFCTTFWAWLRTQGASRGVRAVYTRTWLWQQIEQHGASVRRLYGTQYVLGLSLRPEALVPSPHCQQPDEPADEHVGNSAGDSVGEKDESKCGATASKAIPRGQRESYWMQRERAARLRFGMPTDDLDVKGEREREEKVHRVSRHERLCAQARTYLDDVLVESPDFSLPVRSLRRGLSLHLLRITEWLGVRVSESALETALLAVLRERGILPTTTKQQRLHTVVGWRFRTPDDR